MKAIIWMAALAGALGSSGPARADDDISGSLDVHRTFPVLDRKGKVREVEAGALKLNVDLDGKPGAQELKLNFKGGSAKGKQARLPVPASQKLGASGGTLVLAGKDTGQAFDVRLTVEIGTVYGEPVQSSECCATSCAFSGSEQEFCWCDAYRSITTTRWIRNTGARMALTAGGTADELASWAGERTDAGFDYQYGECR
jgi:hypothetical protein